MGNWFGRPLELESIGDQLLEERDDTDVFKVIPALATYSMERFEQSGNKEDLDLTIVLDEFILNSRPSGHPDRWSSLHNIAMSLQRRYERYEDLVGLEKAIDLCRDSVALCTEGHLGRPKSLSNLGTSLLARFRLEGRDEDLEDPAGHQAHSVSLNNLAGALLAQFTHSGRSQDLDESITLYRIILDLRPEGHSARPNSLSNLASSLLTRFGYSGKNEDLEESVALHRDLYPEGHPNRPYSLNSLALALSTRFEQRGTIEDLHESIAILRTALDLHPDGHFGRSNTLNNLANSLWTRFTQSGTSEDLDEAIELHGIALNLRPDGHYARGSLLTNLASCLLVRFERSGNVADLDSSIALHRSAVDLQPIGHHHRASSLTNLGSSLLTRFEQIGEAKDLDEAVDVYRVALDIFPNEHPQRSMALNNLASALSTRYRHTGQIEDLDESISLSRAAVKLRPYGHPDRAMSLNNLANSLLACFTRDGKREDLDEAITLHRDALDLYSVGHPNHVSSLDNLSVLLSARFQQSGRHEDLDESISLSRAAMKLLPEDHIDRFIKMQNLAASLQNRFRSNASSEDLDESIVLLRSASILCPSNHPDRPIVLDNLANSLATRFRQSNRDEDLDQSIELHRTSLSVYPDGHPDRPVTLNLLGGRLLARFRHRLKDEDLDESISTHHVALDLYSDGHPFRSDCLNNLANSLFARYEKSGRDEDLERSIKLHRAALKLRADGHPLRSSSLNNLANSLLTRFEKSGRRKDLIKSIALFRASLKLQPIGYPDHSTSLSNLAISLSIRFEKEGPAEVFEECMQCLELACTHKFSSLLVRLQIAQHWISLARARDHSSTRNAYKTAVRLLRRAITIRPTLSTQHELLGSDIRFLRLAVDAASYAIEKGDLPEAVELLEQGRALIWSQMRGGRTPLDRLEEVNKSCATRFRDVSHRLEVLITLSASHPSSPNLGGVDTSEMEQSIEDMLSDMRRLSGEQESIISEIRQLPGFEDFLEAAPFATLQQSAQDGPIIIINHSEYRCDALIVLSKMDVPCVCVPLDGDWYEDGINLCNELVRMRLKSKVRSAKYDKTLRRVLEVLWERVVCKVVRKLKELGIGEGSRIWWCPTSALPFLPFHAAGPYKGTDGSTRYLLDDYISSYTPTLRSLISARSEIQKRGERMLFVGDMELPAAKREGLTIKKWRQVDKLLVGKYATRDAVISALRDVEWVHFTCHGILDPEPFNSSFKLFDGRLTLLDIARSRLPNAEFAFLSACHTAEQAPNVVFDEVLNLAAAIQFCGFRSVVETMWQLLDKDGPFLADNVYRRLTDDADGEEFEFKRAAAGVREAALGLRDRGEKGLKVERWVNLVHIGA